MVLAPILDHLIPDRKMDGFHNFMESRVPKKLSLLSPALSYYTPKFIKVDYWPIGLFALTLKLCIVFYVIWQLSQPPYTWAYRETPMGTVNAFGGADLSEGSAWLAEVKRSQADLPYCLNEAHAYEYSNQFNYSTPQCRFVVPEELVTKGKGQLQVATVFLENKYVGWPCSSSDANEKETECSGRGGTKYEFSGGQCVCRSVETVYPIGPDKLDVEFEHTYEFPVDKDYEEYKGTSTATAEEAKKAGYEPLESMVCFGGDCKTSDEKRWFAPSRTVKMGLDDWLRAAGTSLDKVVGQADGGMPDKLGRDGANGSPPRYPYRRMTGMVITVFIKYSNADNPATDAPGARTFFADNRRVYANITARTQLLPWAGPGSQRINIQYPEGGLGNETFEYIDRYAQGVVFDFQSTGIVYRFDYVYFINVLVVALVMLGVAGTVTDFICFSCLPGGHSAVLSAHRFEVASRAAHTPSEPRSRCVWRPVRSVRTHCAPLRPLRAVRACRCRSSRAGRASRSWA